MENKGKLNDKNLEKVSGRLRWEIPCARCGSMIIDGQGVIRLKSPGAQHPYFCTECGEELLNNGKATIEKGYEYYYEKYPKKMVDRQIIYGWKHVED